MTDGEGRGTRSFWPRHRIRRPSDVARLLLCVGLLLLLLALSVWAPAIGNGLRLGISGLPRDVLSVANAAASLAVLCSQLAIAVDALRRRRYALVTAAMAAAVGAGLAVAAQKAGEAGWVATLGTTGDPAVVPIAAGLAFVIGADLQWSRRLRTLAYTALTAATVCALALGSLTVPGALAGALLGATAGLGVRVAAGVVPARPREQTVRDVLSRAGLAVSTLRPLQEAAGRVRYASSDADGDLVITVVDPDRRGVALARRLWRVLRFRTGVVGRPALSLRGGLERRALVAGLARSAHVPVPAVLALLAAGPALVLVERPLGGTPLPAAGPDGGPPGAKQLDAAFSALRRLHAAGLAHGSLTADAVVLGPDGAGFTDLWSAQAAAGELQQDLDVVTMLAALAATAGAEAAVAALRSGYATSPSEQARLAALLQPLALARPVRRAVHGTTVLDDLRTALTGPDGGPPVHAPRLERIRARTVLSLAGATLAAHVLVTQLSSVGIGTALQGARVSWLGVALFGSALTYLGAALVLGAFVPSRLPLGRTTLVQLASSFVTLVTPPTVGHVGINLRYLQRSGIPTATAGAVVGVSQAVTVAVTVLLLLLCGWLSGVSPSRPSLLPSGDVLGVLLGAAALLAVAVAVPATRRLLRRRLEPLVRRALPQLMAAATDPRRLATAALGVLVLNGGNVLALDASLRAFSVAPPLAGLVVVYLVASTVGSAAPTPGGLGAVEAALVGGLTATGVPVATALAAVLVFRTVTFWLPAPVGWLAFVALQRQRRI